MQTLCLISIVFCIVLNVSSYRLPRSHAPHNTYISRLDYNGLQLKDKNMDIYEDNSLLRRRKGRTLDQLFGNYDRIYLVKPSKNRQNSVNTLLNKIVQFKLLENNDFSNVLRSSAPSLFTDEEYNSLKDIVNNLKQERNLELNEGTDPVIVLPKMDGEPPQSVYSFNELVL